MKNTDYRHCIKGFSQTIDYPFVSKNEYGIDCCTIDKIVQVTYYGCTPQEIINKQSDKYEKEN